MHVYLKAIIIIPASTVCSLILEDKCKIAKNCTKP